MPTPISLSDEQRQNITIAFAEYLKNFTPKSNIFDFKTSLLTKEVAAEKMYIYVSPEAKLKMEALVANVTTEVGWHGTVHRIDKHSFLIEDILVYPQVVTGANVNPDEVKYTKFLTDQPDEIFEKLRFQGHSHVNFTTAPSSVDEIFYHEILKQLRGDDYYIFMILNKHGEMMVRLYDMATQLVYDTKDCIVETILLDGVTTLQDWFIETKKLVETKVYNYTNNSTLTTPNTTRCGFDPNELDDPGYAGYHNYSGYTGYSGNTGSEIQSVTPLNSDTPKDKKAKDKDKNKDNRRVHIYGSR
jgi:hypothetical protein